MARLTEEMVIARSKQSDLSAIKKLNCWGAELGDVSLLRRMPNVEVLALSINKIRTLHDFAWCPRLRELYVRKNEISDLREVRHLRRLPHLASLWLDENPCTMHDEYRMTVLRALPHLQKLDNVCVCDEERAAAQRRGHHIPDSDDEEQEQYSNSGGGAGSGRRGSGESSPEREMEPYQEQAETTEAGAGSEETRPDPAQCVSPLSRRGGGSLDEDRCEAAMTRSHYEMRRERSPEPRSPLRHSLSAHSVKTCPAQEHSYASNGECRGGGGAGGGLQSPPHEHYYERPDRGDWPNPPNQSGGRWGGGGGGGEYASAVMGERRGFTRRPVTRNSNLLSAVLCLVKELDYPSLEVAEMAVRCRMDELANAQ